MRKKKKGDDTRLKGADNRGKREMFALAFCGIRKGKGGAKKVKRATGDDPKRRT